MSEPITQSLISISLEQGKDTKFYNIDADFEALKGKVLINKISVYE